MDLSVFESMDRPEMRRYLEFLLWHYRVADSFWFLNVTERYGQSVAEDLNTQVWGRIGGMGARDLIKRFNIQEKGLAGFARVLSLYPWSILIGYRLEYTTAELMTLSVPSCPTQVARLKRNLGEYHCKEMHHCEFRALAQAVDQRIQVECVFAPPDPHPPEMFCQWRFRLEV